MPDAPVVSNPSRGSSGRAPSRQNKAATALTRITRTATVSPTVTRYSVGAGNIPAWQRHYDDPKAVVVSEAPKAIVQTRNYYSPASGKAVGQQPVKALQTSPRIEDWSQSWPARRHRHEADGEYQQRRLSLTSQRLDRHEPLHLSLTPPRRRRWSFSGPRDRELRILVVGGTGVGKSTLISRLVGRGAQPKIGHTLMSCTSEVQTFPCELDGHRFSLVDTAGFDDNRMADTEVLRRLALYLASGPTIHGVIFCHRISDTRLTGTAAQTAQVIYQMCGAEFLDQVALVTTMWDRSKTPLILEAREQQLLHDARFWGPFHDSRPGRRPAQSFRLSQAGGPLVDKPEDIMQYFLDDEQDILTNPMELQLTRELRRGGSLGSTAAATALMGKSSPPRGNARQSHMPRNRRLSQTAVAIA